MTLVSHLAWPVEVNGLTIVDKSRTGLETREIVQYVIVLEIFDHMTKEHPRHSCNMADCQFKTRHGKLCFQWMPY